MKNAPLKIKKEKYVPRMEYDLIPKRIAFLSSADYKVTKFIEGMVAREDAVYASKQPLGEIRKLDIPDTSHEHGLSVWSLIKGCMP